MAGLCNRSRQQQQRDRDHDDDQRDEEQGLVRTWSAKGERHKPSYRSVTPLDARRFPTFNRAVIAIIVGRGMR